MKDNKSGRLISSGIENVANSMYDTFVYDNAEIRESAGLAGKVKRVVLGDCCEWCRSIEGTYDNCAEAYAAGAFYRHQFCRCMTTYITEKGQHQDVWSKKKYDTEREARIAREKEIEDEIENSNKQRKAMIQETITDKKVIKSSAYRKRLQKIDEDVEIVRKLRENIEDITLHRSGTEFEDLVFIDSKTGKSISCKWFNEVRACKPSYGMTSMLENAEEYSIIGLHNHPYGSPPSYADIKIAHERKYKYGLIAGNNGTLYKYTITENYNGYAAQPFIDNLNAAYYNGASIDELKEKMENIKQFGVIIEVL